MKKSILFLTMIFLPLMAWSQVRQVSGVVFSEDDRQPVTGASILVKGSPGEGTITNIDGKFTLKVKQGSTLIIRYIGYKEEQIQVGTSDISPTIFLKPESTLLNEVVAIGYGTMKKSDITGSVSVVGADKIKQLPVSGIDQALQGRAAGVTINTNSGQPGATATVRIRGIGSVLSSSDPVYVVDGVILDNISFLSPSDISSTEILKDASATAIFGSRGANGVILITTKKGNSNPKANISVESYYGVQNRWNKLDLMLRDEFVNTIANFRGTSAYLNTNGLNKWIEYYTGKKSPFFPKIKTDAYPQGMDYTTVDTDWQDEVFKSNAVIQNHYVSIEGGSKTSSYAMSAGYFTQQGTIIGSDYQRLTLRTNASNQVRDWLKVGENLTFMTSTGRNAMNNNASPGASILSAAIAMAPWDPTHYPQGAWSYSTTVANGYPNGRDLSNQIAASSNFRNVVNPFSMVENSVPNDKSERWVGDVYVELTPIKGLVIRSDISMDLANNTSKLFKYAYLYSSFDKSDKNFFASSMARYSTIINENTITYSKKIDKHDFTVLAGQTSQEFNFYSLGGSGATILNPVPTNWLLAKTTDDRSYAGDAIARTRMFSLLSRVHYQYDNKYMVTANFRMDGSNKFPENPWGYFPSMALGWKMSEESFMKNIENLDFLKVRAGWGQIGNDKINSDMFITSMFNSGPTFSDYVLGTTQALANGATVLTYANAGGKWETSEQLNAGVDFGFFNGKITGSLELFQRDTKDALLTVKGPAYAGNRYDAMANAATVRNQGIELSLDHKNKIGDLEYNIGGNVSFIRNELTALNGGEKIYYNIDNILLCDEGLPINTFWGYRYIGVFKTDQEALDYKNSQGIQIQPGAKGGDAIYKDLNDDGKIDDSDRGNLGNPFPWLNYGLNLSLYWKGFDMQCFFQGIYGNQIYNALRYRTEGKGEEATLSTTMRNVWTKDNPNGTVPNPYGSTNNFRASSRFIEDGSYFRLKNLQIGYTVPASVTQKLQVERARVYISGSNLLTLTKYTGYDPEIGGGVDFGNYPQARTMLMGIQLNF